MEHTSAELKRLSREKLVGHWGLVIGATLLLLLIAYAVLLPFYLLFFITGGGMVQFITYVTATLILGVIATVMECGISRMHLNFARNQKGQIGMLFGEFTNRPDRYILGILMLFGMEFLCMLPGGVCWGVGVMEESALAMMIGVFLYLMGAVLLAVIALRYQLVLFLLIDYPKMGAIEAFRESSRLMHGNKGRMFYLYLSFIGWHILGMMSAGIGMLWVTPYMNQTIVHFYMDVTGELDRIQNQQQQQQEYRMPDGTIR